MAERPQRIRVEGPEAGVAIIVLDRPERRNALDAALVAGLREALGTLDRDPDVRVVGLRGAGDDFCAGADLREVRASVEAGVLASMAEAQSLGDLFVEIRRMRRPVVALVHGHALAGGCGLASACDLVVASAGARFGYPEVRLGFVPAMVMAILRRSVGETRAFEIVARGEMFDADTAERWGLVNRVIADESFLDGSNAYLSDLAARSASALELTKRLLYQIDGADFESAIRAGAEVNAIARLTDDCQAGIDRFLNRDDRTS